RGGGGYRIRLERRVDPLGGVGAHRRAVLPCRGRGGAGRHLRPDRRDRGYAPSDGGARGAPTRPEVVSGGRAGADRAGVADPGLALGGDSVTFSFANPAFLVLGIVAALLVWVGLVLQTRRRRRLAAHLGSVEEARRRGMARLRRPRLDRKLLLGLAVAFVAVAAAEPTPVTPPPAPAYVSPEPLVIALDISASMQAEDVLPTRLGRAVQVARDVVEAAEGREVGLLVFAGKPYVLMPPTSDLAAVRFLLE